MTVAVAAVVLISLPGGEAQRRRTPAGAFDLAELPIVIVAGLGFAGFFLFLDRATTGGETGGAA